MRIWGKIGAAAIGTAVLVWAVTLNGSLEVLGTLRANIVDFSGAVSSAPMKVGASVPGSCSVGQAFFKTDAAAGQNIYLCTAANTWTQVQGGGGGAWNMKPDLNYILLRSEFSNTYSLGSGVGIGDFNFYRGQGTQNMNMAGSSAMIGATHFSTTATSGNKSMWMATFSAATNLSEGLYAWTNKDWEFLLIFRYPAATDYANSTMFLGLGNYYNDFPPGGLGVKYEAGTDAYLMFYNTGTSNSYGTTLSTGVAPDTNWHKLKIRSDGATQYKAWISLDGGTERSICPSGCDLTIPSSSYSRMQAFVLGVSTAEAASKTIALDYMHLWMNWGTR